MPAAKRRRTGDAAVHAPRLVALPFDILERIVHELPSRAAVARTCHALRVVAAEAPWRRVTIKASKLYGLRAVLPDSSHDAQQLARVLGRLNGTRRLHLTLDAPCLAGRPTRGVRTCSLPAMGWLHRLRITCHEGCVPPASGFARRLIGLSPRLRALVLEGVGNLCAAHVNAILQLNLRTLVLTRCTVSPHFEALELLTGQLLAKMPTLEEVRLNVDGGARLLPDDAPAFQIPVSSHLRWVELTGSLFRVLPPMHLVNVLYRSAARLVIEHNVFYRMLSLFPMEMLVARVSVEAD